MHFFVCPDVVIQIPFRRPAHYIRQQLPVGFERIHQRHQQREQGVQGSDRQQAVYDNIRPEPLLFHSSCSFLPVILS